MPGVTPISDIPDAPTIGTPIDAGDGTTATVGFTAAVTGGTATTYRVLSTPGSFEGTGASSPVTITGLSAGTAYTFQVRGENSTGNGAYSSASSSLTLAAINPYVPIRSYTVTSGGTASVTFSSIPQTYSHLQIRILGRGSYTYANLLDGTINFNSDATVANYYSHTLKGNGTSATASAEQSPYLKNCFPGANQTASVFGNYIIDVLDYTSTNKYKTVRFLGGVDVNGSGQLNLGSNLWKNTAAISSILLAVDGSWTQYSSIALYGIRA